MSEIQLQAANNSVENQTVVAETEWLLFKISPIHGTGGFARKDIPAETQVIEYVGQKITKADALKQCESNNPYVFTLDDKWDLDGSVSWNPARFLNHSCDPNCEALLDDGRIWIVSTRAIKAGEEVTFNYGYDLVDYRDHPCQCRTEGCVGYIVAEEFFDSLKERQSTVMTSQAGAVADHAGFSETPL